MLLRLPAAYRQFSAAACCRVPDTIVTTTVPCVSMESCDPRKDFAAIIDVREAQWIVEAFQGFLKVYFFRSWLKKGLGCAWLWNVYPYSFFPDADSDLALKNCSVTFNLLFYEDFAVSDPNYYRQLTI